VREGRPSSTARHNALFRALAAAETRAEPPLDDRLSKHFLTGTLAACRPVIATSFGRRAARSIIDRRWPGVRTSVVARTALIDRYVIETARGDLRQLVVLGAGYDTRPYRLAALHDCTVYEVDHPATQRAKRTVLLRHLDRPADHVRFVASDFEADRMTASLRRAGYRPDEPTLVLWEGVTNYLTERAVDRTMRWLATAASASVLVFTYVDADLFDHPELYAGVDRLHATLERVGEDLRFSKHPADLERWLADRGLRLRTDLGATDYRRLHYGHAADDMRGHEFYRVAVADVGASGSP
jgi:methyltransferase (TIGR00027 family)